MLKEGARALAQAVKPEKALSIAGTKITAKLPESVLREAENLSKNRPELEFVNSKLDLFIFHVILQTTIFILFKQWTIMKTKLFFIFSFVFSFVLIHANPLETLEQAIRESDVEKVRNALQEQILSNYDQTCLIDLAQQIIFFRKSQLECYYVGFARRIKHPKITSDLSTKGKISVAVLALSSLSVLIFSGLKDPISETQKILLGLSCITQLESLIVFINEICKKTRPQATELQYILSCIALAS